MHASVTVAATRTPAKEETGTHPRPLLSPGPWGVGRRPRRATRRPTGTGPARHRGHGESHRPRPEAPRAVACPRAAVGHDPRPRSGRAAQATRARTFTAAESSRRRGKADLELALELARRAPALSALDHARLYREAREAVRLPRGSRPPQGRFPGDAGPRVAQPTCPAAERLAHPESDGRAR